MMKAVTPQTYKREIKFNFCPSCSLHFFYPFCTLHIMTHLVSYTGETIIPPSGSSVDSASSEAPLSKAGRPPPIDEDSNDEDDLPPPYQLGRSPSQKRSSNKVMSNIKDKFHHVKASLSNNDQHPVVKNPNEKVPQDAKTNPME